MFYRERLNDDYEIHQRNTSYLKDELDIFVADAKVKSPNWYSNLMSRFGDGLIAIGNSMKERDHEVQSKTFSPSLTR